MFSWWGQRDEDEWNILSALTSNHLCVGFWCVDFFKYWVHYWPFSSLSASISAVSCAISTWPTCPSSAPSLSPSSPSAPLRLLNFPPSLFLSSSSVSQYHIYCAVKPLSESCEWSPAADCVHYLRCINYKLYLRIQTATFCVTQTLFNIFLVMYWISKYQYWLIFI